LFNEMAGIKLVNVPYRNSYIPDLLSGQVQAGFTPILQTLGYIKAGKLRALAVTGVAHSDVLPDVPNAAQFVPGYDVAVWDAVGAPAHTPPEIVDKLNKAINAALTGPKMRAHFTDLGAEPMIMTPAELNAYMVDEVKKWGAVVKTAGIKPE
jgi:tripartite-type tricarboxylate transporter receptor subunit TctC